jgi:hypothetical protein
MFLIVTGFLIYVFAREIYSDSSPWTASVVAVIAAGGIQTLYGYLLADGIVSSLALLFGVSSWLFAVQVFKYDDYHITHILAAGLCFGLSILSHPPNAMFAGWGVFVLYLAYDRSIVGLLSGVVIALTGIVVAIPWVWMVFTQFGVQPFETALAVGFGGGKGATIIDSIRTVLVVSTPAIYQAPFLLWTVAVIGGFYAVAQERWFPVLFVGVSLLLGTKYVYFAEAFLAAPLIIEGLPRILTDVGTPRMKEVVPTAVIILFVLSSVLTGAVFAAGINPTITPEHRQAMGWVENNTSEEAKFVSAGPGNRLEVLPYYTDRQIVGGYWGAEWTSEDSYRNSKAFQQALKNCRTANCLQRTLGDYDYKPDYVYVSGQRARGSFDIETIRESTAFEIKYNRNGVIIATVNQESLQN